MTTKNEIDQSLNKPSASNLLIFQSLNQESFNQRITQSTNQPIKKASARHSNETRAKVFRFRLLPGDGQSNPKTQTTRGGSLTASASGIDRFPVGRPSANSESSRGFITTTKMTDEAAIAKARARGEKYGFTGIFLANFIEHELRLVVKWRNRAREERLIKPMGER